MSVQGGMSFSNGYLLVSGAVGGGGGAAISAGTNISSSGTVNFSNSNGVTFGMDTNGVITASVAATVAGGTANINLSAGTTSNALSAFTFSNSNNVSFGLDAGTMTASVLPSAGFSAGTQSVNTGTMVFSNSNGVTFGMSGSSQITASVNTSYRASNDAIGLNTAGTNVTWTANSSGLSINAAGYAGTGFTSATTAGTAVVATHNTAGLSMGIPAFLTAAAGGGFSGGVSTGGNTLGSTGATGSQLIFAGGNNITLSQSTGANGATITISGANAGGAQTGISSIVVSNGTYTAGEVSFSNANGISFGTSGTGTQQAVTASYTVPTVMGVSAGTQSVNTGTLVFSNSNNVTFGMSGSSRVTASYNFNLSAGTTSNNLNAVTFSNGSGVSFGLNASVLTASVAAQTNQTIGIYGSSQTAGASSSGTADARSLSVVGSGAISVGWSNGSFIIADPGTTALPMISVGASTGGNTAGDTGVFTGQVVFAGGNNITLSGSSNAGSYTLSIAGGAGGGGVAVSAGTQSVSTGTVVWSNSNNVTFGFSGSSRVTASYALNVSAGAGTSNGLSGITFANSNSITFGLSTGAGVGTLTASFSTAAQTNQTIGVYALSNTTQGTSGTVDARSLSFNGAGAVSVGYSNGSVVISAAAGAQSAQTVGLYALGNTTQNSSTTLDARTLSYNALGAMTMGYSNGSIQVSAPATSSLSATGMVSISTNGSTISIGVGTGVSSGTGTALGITLSNNGISLVQPTLTRLVYPDHMLTAISAFGNASMSFQYMPVQAQVTATRLDALVQWSASSSAASNTMGIALSAYAAIFSRNGSSLSSMSSGSTQTTYTYASNSAGQTQLISNAIRPVSVPINVNMAAGEYFVGFNIVTAATSIGANTTNLAQTLSMVGGNNLQSALNYAEFTNQTNTSVGLYNGMGVYSAASTGMPAALSISGINQTGAALSQANIALVFRNA